jgi:type I restriction enzyme M protein
LALAPDGARMKPVLGEIEARSGKGDGSPSQGSSGNLQGDISGEGQIRENIIEADLVDCMVALPGKLFDSTQIPACVWFLARDKRNGRFRDRRGQVLFIDARRMGRMVDRVHRELTNEDIRKIANTYHAWRGDPDAGQ